MDATTAQGAALEVGKVGKEAVSLENLHPWPMGKIRNRYFSKLLMEAVYIKTVDKTNRTK